MSKSSFLGMCLAIFGLAGCGESTSHPKVAPVSGTITYQGKPLAGADVSFFAEKAPRAASGKTDAEGKYKLTMFESNDGAFPGRNVVTVAIASEGVSMEQMMSGKPQAADASKPKLATEYQSQTSTPLSYDVKDGKNENVNFEVK